MARRYDDDYDDYDDEPRSRRRRDRYDDDDDYELRPRKKSGSKSWLIVLVVILVVLVPIGVIGLLIAMLIPAVSKVKESASRMTSSNNLKQIGIAMHNYETVYTGLPPQAITDENGKPLLSWRVAILPFVEQEFLYNQFHFDEPWDSPHNLTLLDQMPQVYAMPGWEVEARTGQTYYQVIYGKGALFEPLNEPKPMGDRFGMPIGRKLARVPDGISNTLMVVEAANAVPWTKPEDIPYTPGSPPTLGEHYSGGRNVIFADGSVRFMPKTTNPATLEAIITADGGEALLLDF